MIKLLEVLQNLDVENDEHWTQDNLPRLDVVKGLFGSDVTRADIANVAPKFNRLNPIVVTETAVKVDPFASADKPELTDSGEVVEELEMTQPQAVSVDADSLEARRAKLEQMRDEASRRVAQAQAVLADITHELDIVLLDIEREMGTTSFSENVQAYQRAQLKESYQTHANQIRMAELMKNMNGLV